MGFVVDKAALGTHDSVEQPAKLLAEETEVLAVNLTQFRFVHHKSHIV
jgi:hypothetical protein